jgi:hypothetical protein
MSRLFRYNVFIKRVMFQIKLNPGYTKLIKVMITMFLLVHLVSCFYYMVAKFTDFDPKSWIVTNKLIDSSELEQ